MKSLVADLFTPMLDKGLVGPETKDCPECLSSVPFGAWRCAYCATVFVDAAAV